MNKMMMYAVAFCLIISIGLTGCQNAANYDNTYHSETDYPYMFHVQGAGQSIAASNNGYYFLNGNFIYYTDKTQMKPVLLDNRPDSDCLTATEPNQIENCNAYVKIEDYIGFLAYSEEKVYTIESTSLLGENNESAKRMELIERSKDGATRKSKLTFDFAPESIAIHRGIVYYSSRDYSKSSELDYQIKQFNLKSSSAKSKTIYNGELPEGHILDIIPYGKNVYFLESAKNMYRTMRYDIQNKEISRMFSDDDKDNPSIGGIFNNQLLFSYFYGDPDDEKAWIQYASDLEGNQIKALPIKTDFMQNLYASGKYIYVRPVWFYMSLEKYKHLKHEMAVYDEQYQPVDQLDLSFLPLDHQLVVGDDNYMFIKYQENNTSYLQYLNKAEIGSGNASFKPLIETPAG